MRENIKQPATHSILRNSQVRRQSSYVDSQQQNKSYQQQNPTTKYHFRYSLSQHQNELRRLHSSHVQNSESQYVNNKEHFYSIRRENIFVCQSLPKTKPKYSFTFAQSEKKLQTNILKVQSINRQSDNTQLKKQDKTQVKNQKKTRNIRSDIDMCLYTISDKLKEMQQAQEIQETKQIINQKLGELEQTSYRPSFSQLRKSRKMFLDKSIHRIHPEIVNQYIQTVYRDYGIPDPLKIAKESESQRVIVDKQVFFKGKTPKVTFQRQQQHSAYQLEPQQKRLSFFQQHQSLYNTKNMRRNNLIQQKSSTSIGKKKYLNLTLSRQKNENINNVQSPQIKMTQQQRNKHDKSKSSKSRQAKRSNSQKKILQIKKNISTWRDHEQQCAHRQTYDQSPYEAIKNKTLHPLSSINSNHEGADSNRQVNIKIRPFDELMKVSTQPNDFQYRTNYTTGYNPSQSTQLQESSKYMQSFFNTESEVPEQFRYCLLCEQPVLSANVVRHEQKCIGWIDDSGRLFMFRDLYKMNKESELKGLMKGKIDQIRRRALILVNSIKYKQIKGQRQSTSLTDSILKTVQELINAITTQKQMANARTHQLLESNYKKIQKISKNQYLILHQQSRKLHWFVKLLQNYESKTRVLFRRQDVNQEKRFTSTRAKHNRSLTFIEEQPGKGLEVSEFGQQNERKL